MSVLNQQALMQLKSRRGNLPRPRKKLPKRQPVWLFPFPVETFYKNALLERAALQEALITEVVFKSLPGIEQERNEELNVDNKLDDFADSIERLLERMVLQLNTVPIDIKALAEKVGNDANAWNAKEWSKQLKAAFSVDIFQREPFLQSMLNSFVKENVSLITKMDQDLIRSIEGTIQRGFRSGQSTATITKELEKRMNVSKSRARLIARDQIGKLNGQLTNQRQTSLGVEKYVWRTSEDEKVRTAHIAQNGKKYAWSKPPANTGHPGQDIQCRCYAEPDFSTVLEDVTL